MRCGKTRLLEVIEPIVPNGILTPNMSMASIYRMIEGSTPRPTFLLDESQSLGQTTTQFSQVLITLFNSSIRRKDVVIRCASSEDNHEPKRFSTFCPKVLALIGDLNGVLADRCLPIRMERSTKDQHDKYRSRTAEPIATAISKWLGEWAEENAKAVKAEYDKAEEFDLQNDRMAELLTPLQSVLAIADKTRLPTLETYAKALDERDAEKESAGVKLLRACKDIFATTKDTKFMLTVKLLGTLKNREDEPWSCYQHGEEITARQVAGLLKPYGIKPGQDKEHNKQRGYFWADFTEPWKRYVSACVSGNGVSSVLSVPSVLSNVEGSARYAERSCSLRSLGFKTYSEYLDSELWQSIRKRVFRDKGRKCFKCKKPASQIHHPSYAVDVMKGDNIEPLKPVCNKCHAAISKKGSSCQH